MNGFKVGDKVKCLCASDFNWSTEGMVGKVVVLKRNLVGVQFTSEVNGHSLNGNSEPGYGWWCQPEELKLFNMTMENK